MYYHFKNAYTYILCLELCLYMRTYLLGALIMFIELNYVHYNHLTPIVTYSRPEERSMYYTSEI